MMRAPRVRFKNIMPGRLTVGLMPLEHGILVRIQARQSFDKLRTFVHEIMWYTYILLCDQKTFYIGTTHDLAERLKQHKRKESFYTKRFSDVQLVYSESFPSRIIAEKREQQLKGWTIAKKKALIAGDIESLKKLSKGHEIVDA